MAPRGRPTRTTRSRPVTTTPPPVTDPTTTTSVTSAQLQAMIDEGVTAVLAARATTRNGDDSHTTQELDARRIENAPFRECISQGLHVLSTLFLTRVKFATFSLMDTALTWWNSDARTVTNDEWHMQCRVKGTDVVAYNQRFQELALLCDRMFPEETDKIERYVGGMPDPIYSSVVASKPRPCRRL
ncbi:hypothetical protein Tco_0911547 [Tanacetum coccineum]|uniref:Retrotransposon gag domain-containing protein n=1 Tax=Tanacetum coccineum TaxID=301880 RepID=A0ABQ5CXK2_9ASTR